MQSCEEPICGCGKTEDMCQCPDGFGNCQKAVAEDGKLVMRYVPMIKESEKVIATIDDRFVLDEIKDINHKRDSIAKSYALLLTDEENHDWKSINAAIKKRWSLRGLSYIKDKAWKEAKRDE